MHDYGYDDDGYDRFFDVMDDETGKPRMLAEKCSTCILRPGDLMHLGPERLREFIDSARRGDTFVICHQTLRPRQAAICRGFADAYSTNLLRIYGRLGGFTDVRPPKPERSES